MSGLACAHLESFHGTSTPLTHSFFHDFIGYCTGAFFFECLWVSFTVNKEWLATFSEEWRYLSLFKTFNKFVLFVHFLTFRNNLIDLGYWF